jgi:xylose isomerase
MYGYTGYFGPDLNPERIPIRQALKNNFDALNAANERINSLDHEEVIMSHAEPGKNRGWLEAYLIRKRWPNAKLAPLPAFEK